MQDILARLTNVDELDALMEAAENQLRHIDPAELARNMKARVQGQDHVIDYMCDVLAKRQAQVKRNGPLLSVLLSGPSSTGKTEIAKALTEALYGDEKNMTEIACGDLGSYGIEALVGTQQGYSGGEGTLTKRIRSMPETVVLFDEIEKAANSPEAPLTKMLFSLLGEGKLQDQRTMEHVDASGIIIIMTSNAEERELARLAKQIEDAAELAQQAKIALENKPFPVPLLKRIHVVTTTRPLDRHAKLALAAMKLEKVVGQYNLKIVDDGLDPAILLAAMKWLAQEGNTFREYPVWLDGCFDNVLEVAKSSNRNVKLTWDALKEAIVFESADQVAEETPVSFEEEAPVEPVQAEKPVEKPRQAHEVKPTSVLDEL